MGLQGPFWVPVRPKILFWGQKIKFWWSASKYLKHSKSTKFVCRSGQQHFLTLIWAHIGEVQNGLFWRASTCKAWFWEIGVTRSLWFSAPASWKYTSRQASGSTLRRANFSPKGFSWAEIWTPEIAILSHFGTFAEFRPFWGKNSKSALLARKVASMRPETHQNRKSYPSLPRSVNFQPFCSRKLKNTSFQANFP